MIPTRSLAALAAALVPAVPLVAQDAPEPPRQDVRIIRERAPGAPGATDRRIRVVMNRRARLGVSVNMQATASDSIGALINAVTPGGPADKAGLRSGDIITKLDGKPLTGGSASDAADESVPGLRLVERASALAPSTTVDVEFRRGKETRTVKLVTAEEAGPAMRDAEDMVFVFDGMDMDRMERDIARARDMAGRMPMRIEVERMRGGPGGSTIALFGGPLADLELTALNPSLGAYFGTAEGVLVTNIPDGNAFNLKPGDVILAVDGRKPSSPSHLMRILRSYEGGETVKLDLMRNKAKQSVTGTVERRSRRPGELRDKEPKGEE